MKGLRTSIRASMWIAHGLPIRWSSKVNVRIRLKREVRAVGRRFTTHWATSKVRWKSWRHVRLACQFKFFKFCFMKSLSFCPSVLKPYFNLRFREIQRGREFRSLGYRKVLFLSKFSFQSKQLWGCKRRSWFSISLVLPQLAFCGAQSWTNSWRREEKED